MTSTLGNPTAGPSLPTGVDDQLKKAAEQLEKIHKEAQEKFNSILHDVNYFLALGAAAGGALAGPLGALGGAAVAWWVSRHTHEIRDALVKVYDLWVTLSHNAIPVVSLIEHSFYWLNEVRKPASGITYKIVHEQNFNVAQWDAPAAKRYGEINGQQAAATQMQSDRAAEISVFLFAVAQSNVDYILKIVEIAGKLLGKLVDAAIKAETVIDIPWAISTLSEQAGDLVDESFKMATQYVRDILKAVATYQEALAKETDLSTLGPDGWPMAVRG